MLLVDGHLDLAMNVLAFDRDPRRSALETRALEGDRGNEPRRGLCTVGLPELRRARVAVVMGTIFVGPRRAWTPGGTAHDDRVTYDSDDEAERNGLAQLDVYRALHDEATSGFRMIGTRAELAAVLDGWKDGATGDVGIVPLLEGADPIRDPDAVDMWRERGLRAVGLAWRGTRWAGGTGEPGPLTEGGRALVRALDAAGLVHDLSHLAEESCAGLLDLAEGPVMASHANPRAICPGDRQLADGTLRSLAARDGVVGVVPYAPMLRAGWRDEGRPSVPLRRVAEAARHVADVTGSSRHVALGSDLDGGFGAESTPAGLDTAADLPRLAGELADLGFPDDAIYDILGRNWIRFLERTLPEE